MVEAFGVAGVALVAVMISGTVGDGCAGEDGVADMLVVVVVFSVSLVSLVSGTVGGVGAFVLHFACSRFALEEASR